MSYVKLFESILASTIWAESDQTRLVWITMLAMADRDGIVQASCPGLAHFARVSVPACEKALAVLARPDKDSRTKLHDGRRIKTIEGGWLILNYELHRERATKEERREKDRLRQERKRLRDAAKLSRDVTLVTAVTPESQKVAYSDSDSLSESASEEGRKEGDFNQKDEEGVTRGHVEVFQALNEIGIMERSNDKRWDFARSLSEAGLTKADVLLLWTSVKNGNGIKAPIGAMVALLRNQKQRHEMLNRLRRPS
jgi:hypothetical protein